MIEVVALLMFLKGDLTKSRIYNMERFELIEKNITDVKKEVCTKKKTNDKTRNSAR